MLGSIRGHDPDGASRLHPLAVPGGQRVEHAELREARFPRLLRLAEPGEIPPLARRADEDDRVRLAADGVMIAATPAGSHETTLV